jgi:hypothetical protein
MSPFETYSVPHKDINFKYAVWLQTAIQYWFVPEMSGHVFLQKEASDVADINCQVVMHIGVISQSRNGWTKELNLVSWNDQPPKYDIRDWSPDHSQLGRGVTLTREELLELRDLLNRWEL